MLDAFDMSTSSFQMFIRTEILTLVTEPVDCLY